MPIPLPPDDESFHGNFQHDTCVFTPANIPFPTSSVDEATPSSLGRGIRGAPPGEEVRGETEESVGRNKELDGEQMRAPGEGEVAGVVDQKPGATGEQDDQAADMDK